jgi:iron complex outermembrane receptor protein
MRRQTKIAMQVQFKSLSLSKKTSITAAVAALFSAWAGAQTLEEVVVTASRSAQRSFDAPAAIQSVNRSVIEQGGPQVNLSESLNRVPGLTILNRQNYAQDLQVSIRGFGARSPFGIRGIRLLVDGIPATTPDGQGQGSSISLTSTERMEVLRGPLAQMYGNSSGGVIQAFTRAAPETPEFDASVYTGSFGMTRTDWQYAGRTGSYGLVADYSTFDIDGFRANSATERKQFNGKLSFDPNEKTHVNVVFNRFDMPLAQDPLGLTRAQLQADPTQAGNGAVLQSVRKVVLQNQLGATLETQVDANRSVLVRAYTGTRENMQYQTRPPTTGTNGGWVGLDRTYYGAGLQYKAQSKLGALPVNWLVGYDYDLSTELRQGGATALGEKSTTTRNEDNQATNGDLFAQGTWSLSESVSLVTGARRSQVKLQSDDHYLNDGNGSGSVEYSKTNPVLGLTYNVNDKLNLFASYGKGFESPTLAEVAYLTTSTPGFNTTINASSSEHYELGSKWQPSGTSRVDFSAFQINSTDEIVVSSSSGGNSVYKNAPGTRRTGWEFSGRTLLGEKVRLLVSASQIDATYSKAFTSTVNGARIEVASGNHIPGIPQYFMFSEFLWSQWPMDVSRNGGALGSQAGLELTRAGRLYANDINTASADGYTTLNLKASHAWKMGSSLVTAFARIDNLTDEKYVGSVIVNQTSFQYYEPAPGRNWSLGLRVSVPL